MECRDRCVGIGVGREFLGEVSGENLLDDGDVMAEARGETGLDGSGVEVPLEEDGCGGIEAFEVLWISFISTSHWFVWHDKRY